MTRRGVSLHSFQQAYYLGRMSLEDCITACAEMGVQHVVEAYDAGAGGSGPPLLEAE